MGFASGFQVGAQAVERGLKMREEDELKRGLAEAFKAPTTDFGYTPEQMAEMRRMQTTDAYDIQAVPGAEGQVPTLRYAPRQGLDLQGDTPAPPTDFAPQQVQRYGGQTVAGQFSPDQIRGLQMREAARVIGASGDPVRASQLLQQADDIDYNAKLRPLQLESVKGQIAGQAQERDLKGIQLKGLTRIEAEAAQATNFANYAAERPDAPIAELKEAAFKQFKFTPKQWQDTVTTRLGIENAEMDSFKNNVKKKLQGKNLTQLGSLYNSDPDFDDKTDLAIVPGKGGAVTLNFIDKATGKITSSQSFKNEALATEYLNKQATEPETMGSWMMNLRKIESAIDAQGAAIVASNAAANLSNVRAGGLKRDSATMAKLDKIEQEFDALTPEEKTGTKGRALITSYNMASAGPGRQLSLGAAVKPEFTPKDYAATIKSFTDTGLSYPAAKIEADLLYGRGPAAGNEDAALQAANKKKGLGLATAPIEVRPGESRMTVPGAAVRGPLEDFLRESRRGMFGGVEYFYTDPLTKKRYTTEQYNQLQNQ
jgi:hypothetical protein